MSTKHTVTAPAPVEHRAEPCEESNKSSSEKIQHNETCQGDGSGVVVAVNREPEAIAGPSTSSGGYTAYYAAASCPQKTDENNKNKVTGFAPEAIAGPSTSSGSYTANYAAASCSQQTDENNKNKVTGFARGLMPEKIVGVTRESGEIILLVKWYGCDEVDAVPAKEANIICPQQVIEFYEDRGMWKRGESTTTTDSSTTEEATSDVDRFGDDFINED